MSITLTESYYIRDLQGNVTEISNIKILGFKIDKTGKIMVILGDSTKDYSPIGEPIQIDSINITNNLLNQAEQYLVNQNIIEGTKD